MAQANLIENIDITTLYKIIMEKQRAGFRLVQMCATAFEGYNELIYSVALGYEVEHYKVVLPLEEQIVSISDLFPSAMLYENEMKELFGVKVDGINLDYDNKFYRIEKETPFKKQIKVVKKEDKDNG